MDEPQIVQGCSAHNSIRANETRRLVEFGADHEPAAGGRSAD